jgi:hypothetical protein
MDCLRCCELPVVVYTFDRLLPVVLPLLLTKLQQ